MPLSAPASLSARATLGTCLASTIVLVRPLRMCFSEEVQPLLPTAAVFVLVCAGASLEETAMNIAEALFGTFGAVLAAACGRGVSGFYNVPVDSWLTVAVLLEASVIVGIICLLPVAESVKIWMVGNTSYFMMTVFSNSQLSTEELCVEYMAISLFGVCCLATAFYVPLPGIANASGLHQAAHAVEDVANSCAELITEATSAFLQSGAGPAWRAMARFRTRIAHERLTEARFALDCRRWDPTVLMARASKRGRRVVAVRQAQQEAAFAAAVQAIDTCRLLCEMAMHAHAHEVRLEAIAVRAAASGKLVRVAEVAAELLRDFARRSFQQDHLRSLQSTAEEVLQAVARDPHRLKLRHAARAALRNSSAVARELLMLGAYSEDSKSPEMPGISQSELASAGSDVAAYLFLTHALAADLLHKEGSTIVAAKQAMSCKGQVEPDHDNASEVSGETAVTEDADLERGPLAAASLRQPLLQHSASGGGFAWSKSPTSLQEGSLQSWLRWCWMPIKAHSFTLTRRSYSAVRTAVKMRWRIALKVLLSFIPACAASIVLFGADTTVASTAAYLCSYGSQYTGGSLKKSALRAVGVAAGAAVGSAMQQVVHLLEQLTHSTILVAVASILAAGSWCAIGMLLHFRGGPYSNAGHCATFTAVKFILCSFEGCTDFDHAVMFTMYACLLTTAVEMTVLPVEALDLLRSRLSAALVGAVAVLSPLVTATTRKATEAFVSPQVAGEALRSTREMSVEMHCSTGASAMLLRTFLRDAEKHQQTFTTAGAGVSPEAAQNKAAANGFTPPSGLAHGAAAIPGVPEPSDAGRSEAGGLQDLPDLTERIKKAGMYDGYCRWKSDYIRWRSGASRGSHGELTARSAATTVATSAGGDSAAPGTGPAARDRAASSGEAAHRDRAASASTVESATSAAAPPRRLSKSSLNAIAEDLHQDSEDDALEKEHAARVAARAEAHAFMPMEESADSMLEPIAGVVLPVRSEAVPTEERGDAQGYPDAADDILLVGGGPAPFAEGMAGLEALLLAGAQDEAAGEQQRAMNKKQSKLDPEAAAMMPRLAELQKHVRAAAMVPPVGGGTDRQSERTELLRQASDGSTAEVVRAATKPPGRQVTEGSASDIDVPPLPGSAESAEFVALPGFAGSIDTAKMAPQLRGIPENMGHEPSGMVSLAEVHTLLDEIGAALAPAPELGAQAAERLDGERVDAHAWVALADAVGLVRLRLSLLARVTNRLHKSVGVAELLGGNGEEAAAAELVAAYNVALAAATSAVAGGPAPSHAAAAKLEAQLRDSAAMLTRARATRPALQPARGAEGRARIAGEVLARTAGSTLVALLRDVAEVLAHAVVLAGSSSAGPPAGGEAVRLCGAGTATTATDASALALSTADLPDLTWRLKRAGQYDKYLAWREGYLRWRSGGLSGAHGEVAETTTT